MPPADARALADAVTGSLADDATRERLGAAGRAAAAARTFDGMLDEIEDVYEHVLGAPRGRAVA